MNLADILLGQGYSKEQVNKMMKASGVVGGNVNQYMPVGGRLLPKKKFASRMDKF